MYIYLYIHILVSYIHIYIHIQICILFSYISKHIRYVPALLELGTLLSTTKDYHAAEGFLSSAISEEGPRTSSLNNLAIVYQVCTRIHIHMYKQISTYIYIDCNFWRGPMNIVAQYDGHGLLDMCVAVCCSKKLQSYSHHSHGPTVNQRWPGRPEV